MKTPPPEPVITINGVALTTAQSMTVRVAITHFQSCVSDNIGPIAGLYRERCDEVLDVIFGEE